MTNVEHPITYFVEHFTNIDEFQLGNKIFGNHEGLKTKIKECKKAGLQLIKSIPEFKNHCRTYPWESMSNLMIMCCFSDIESELHRLLKFCHLNIIVVENPDVTLVVNDEELLQTSTFIDRYKYARNMINALDAKMLIGYFGSFRCGNFMIRLVWYNLYLKKDKNGNVIMPDLQTINFFQEPNSVVKTCITYDKQNETVSTERVKYWLSRLCAYIDKECETNTMIAFFNKNTCPLMDDAILFQKFIEILYANDLEELDPLTRQAREDVERIINECIPEDLDDDRFINKCMFEMKIKIYLKFDHKYIDNLTSAYRKKLEMIIYNNG
jgi:hypothetical protein